MKRVWIALLLLALLLSSLPLYTAAEGYDEQTAVHEQMIRDAAELYRQARRMVGVKSFHGNCAGLVNAQTYLLGLDAHRSGLNGNMEFDYYNKMELTACGYRVRSFPASAYTLRQALDAITACGQVDAYNLLVGFQRTNTELGQTCGHAMFINAIIDGTVYFTESYSTSLGGRYWSEGTTIYCDIETFCNFYAPWAQFEGVIYFGRYPGTTVSEQYDAAAYALTNQETPIYSVLQAAEGAQAELELPLGTGMELRKILRTVDGWWYEAQWQGGLFYVPADRLTVLTPSEFTPKLTDFRGPTVQWAGVGCVLKGKVQASGEISVTAEVLNESGQVVLSNTLTGNGSVDLRKLSMPMRFGGLGAGLYHLRISASRGICALENGEIRLSMQEQEVWNGEFRIVKSGERYVTLSFQAEGGQNELDQVILPKGAAPEELPTAVKNGYKLLGWSADPEQQEPVTEQTVFDKNTTLYALWARDRQAEGGWQYADGVLSHAGNGWTSGAGFRFYLDESGKPLSQWQELENKAFYFNEYGVQRTGWVELDGALRFLYLEGGWPTGWATIGDQQLCFDESGAVKLGWFRSGGRLYRQFFTENGLVSRYMPCPPDDFYTIRKAAIPMPTGK